VWLTEIVSAARRYAEIAPEQLGGLARWSVLLGAIVLPGGRLAHDRHFHLALTSGSVTRPHRWSVRRRQIWCES